MWIQHEPGDLVKLRNEHTNGEVVKFNSNGTAQVPAEIGEQLVENHSDITEKS